MNVKLFPKKALGPLLLMLILFSLLPFRNSLNIKGQPLSPEPRQSLANQNSAFLTPVKPVSNADLKGPNEYMTILCESPRSHKVYVSMTTGEYEIMDLSDKVHGTFDYRPVLDLIRKYEDLGWEIVENQFGYRSEQQRPFLYFLLTYKHH